MKNLKRLCSVALVVVLCLSLSVVCFAGEANLSGDATGDKSVDIRDVIRMKKYMTYVTDTINLGAVDFDSNDEVNTDELVVVRKMLLNSIEPEMIINVQDLEKF